ncbi:hypothetical protein [Synechococcus sp. MW101C3]|uniref:hypothetical protein n=1 Tax=Synechococcus sp. MW101C3 TaxID=210768 RepID=UPI0011817BE9|nr:hypothetical protein [Synechococcus sp. MW101C3]
MQEKLLIEMEKLVPWVALIHVIEARYPKAGSNGGFSAYLLRTMLHVHLMQQRYDLSNPAMVDALIEVPTPPGSGMMSALSFSHPGLDGADPCVVTAKPLRWSRPSRCWRQPD